MSPDQSVDEAEGGVSTGTAAATAYRIVQDCLTNARKHAPGSPVRVVVRTGGARELAVTVTNLLDARPVPPSGIPGTGTGLRGLGDRFSLLGGPFREGM